MNICVFGSSSDKINKEFLDTAERLGREIAGRGHSLVYGAGKYGVMGAAARGVTAEHGEIIGVVPEFFKEMNVIYDGCTELVFTESMRERKGVMEERSDVFVICAGGMGTFEEFFEVLTLKQLHRHCKPIIIYNVRGYYDSLLAMLSNAVENEFMTDDCNRLFTVANTLEEVFAQIENYEPFQYDKYNFVYEGEEEE